MYIVNGDTPVQNEKQLREFYERVFIDEQLIVNQVGGVDDKWNSTGCQTNPPAPVSGGGNWNPWVLGSKPLRSRWRIHAACYRAMLPPNDGVLVEVGQALLAEFSSRLNSQSILYLVETYLGSFVTLWKLSRVLGRR